MTNFKWKKIESFTRYYLNEDYAKWKYNIQEIVLEIGAGRLERYTKKSITLDISRKFEPDILASGYDLPFKDNVFDTIISIEVMEHLEKPQVFVNEIHRVLKSGGAYFIVVPFIHPIHGVDYFRYTKLSLQTLFKKFQIVNIEEQGSIISVLSQLTVLFLRLPLFWNIFSIFYALIARIDRHGPKELTLGYSIYGVK